MDKKLRLAGSNRFYHRYDASVPAGSGIFEPHAVFPHHLLLPFTHIHPVKVEKPGITLVGKKIDHLLVKAEAAE